jgi:hypothetical protein
LLFGKSRVTKVKTGDPVILKSIWPERWLAASKNGWRVAFLNMPPARRFSQGSSIGLNRWRERGQFCADHFVAGRWRVL